MAYRTYTTDALILGSFEGIAADRTIALLTREAGLVYARAVSVRREVSKLRYGLQDFSRVTVSLVRGRRGWKVVGAERSDNLYFRAPDRERRAALLRILRLVRRLVRGEGGDRAFYDQLLDDVTVLVAADAAELVALERTLALRLLASLGYVPPHTRYDGALAAGTLREATTQLADAMAARAAAVAVDRALTASQL